MCQLSVGPLTVHPRACGELDYGGSGVDFRDGSSPRVRGTRPSLVPFRRRRRFIPARAGNSSAIQHEKGGTPVHPRACGELPFYKGLIIKVFLDVKERTN